MQLTKNFWRSLRQKGENFMQFIPITQKNSKIFFILGMHVDNVLKKCVYVSVPIELMTIFRIFTIIH